jgi:glucose-6-phosphate isomerase
MGDHEIQVLRNRHFAIMDALIVHPEWTQQMIAESLNYSEQHLSDIVNASLFKTAFREYRQKYEKALRESIVEATQKAIKVSMEIMENKNEPAMVRQISVRDILAQGHAKAVEKSARLNMEMEIPSELLPRMEAFMKEVAAPFIPKKLLERPEEPDEESKEGREG